MEYKSLAQKCVNRVQVFPMLICSPVAVFALAAAIYHITNAAYVDAAVMLLISAAMWFVFIRELPISRFSRYLKEVEKLGSQEQVFAHLETLKPNIFAEGADLRFDKTYIAYAAPGEAVVKSAGELVWGHLHNEIVSQKLGGVLPMGQERRQGVMVRFSDGSSFLVRLSHEEACIDVLEELKARYPYMMMGYTPELEAVFIRNPKELWSAAGYQNVKE